MEVTYWFDQKIRLVTGNIVNVDNLNKKLVIGSSTDVKIPLIYDVHAMKITYAFNMDGVLVDANEANKGVGYCCPTCKEKVVLRKGNVRAAHFSDKSNCEGALETILHLLGKKIIKDNLTVFLPELTHQKPETYGFIPILDAQWISFDNVVVEKRLGNIVPDLVLYKNGLPLCRD